MHADGRTKNTVACPLAGPHAGMIDNAHPHAMVAMHLVAVRQMPAWPSLGSTARCQHRACMTLPCWPHSQRLKHVPEHARAHICRDTSTSTCTAVRVRGRGSTLGRRHNKPRSGASECDEPRSGSGSGERAGGLQRSRSVWCACTHARATSWLRPVPLVGRWLACRGPPPAPLAAPSAQSAPP